jgi:hypothetical protein
MDTLKLFVVGQISGEHERWNGDRVFVIAHSPEEAATMADGDSAIEVPMDRPFVLGHFYSKENL